jgi:hypothetical protein
MLYDKRWDAKTDVFSVESLVAWLEKQQPTAEYDFWCLKCLLGRYFTDAGFDLRMIGTGSFTLSNGEQIQLPPNFNHISLVEPHTYGAALERARKALR